MATKGIVIRNSRGVRIEDCVFENLDIAIEAEGVADLHLEGNKVVETRVKLDPKLAEVFSQIVKSNISEKDQKEMINAVGSAAVAVQRGEFNEVKEREVSSKVISALGKGFWDVVKALLVQAAAEKMTLIWGKI